MCRPDHFAVTYAINFWMNPGQSVDRDRAIHQWKQLVSTYEQLGHEVDFLDPLPGLPDMVFAANGAFVVGDRALGARFRERVRAAEAPAHRDWLRAAGITVYTPQTINEGEGDFVWAYGRILAGTGFRSDPTAHVELTTIFDVPVVPLQLIDPRFYHLDTALFVLDRDTVAYYPPAFAPASQERLARLYPDAILASEADALAFGLNSVSDGRHVVMAEQAENLLREIARAGFEPIPIDTSELLKAGGGVKCTTLELHTDVPAEPALNISATAGTATAEERR